MLKNKTGWKSTLDASSSPALPSFDTADLFAGFNGTAKTRKGTETISMTRATAAWEMDHDYIWQKLDNNELMFRGARRVKNYLAYSEDFSNAAWAKSATATNTGTNQLNFPAVNDYVSQFRTDAELLEVGAKLQGTVKLWCDTADVGKTVYVRVQFVGSSSGNEFFDRTITLTAVPTRYALAPASPVNSGHTSMSVVIGRLGGTNATKVYATQAQLEYFVPATPNVNPSEYVSRDKLPAPYHGANVDGVKYFSYAKANTVDSTTYKVNEKMGVPFPEWQLKGVGTEAQSTNLWQESVRVNLGYWSSATFTKTVLSDTGIFGKANGIGRLTGPGTNSSKQVRNNSVIPVTASALHSVQDWIRPGTSTQRYTQFGLFDSTGAANGAWFTYDAVTGTITETGTTGAGVLDSVYVDAYTIAGVLYHRIYSKIGFGNANTTAYHRISFTNVPTGGVLSPTYLDAGEVLDIAHVQVQTACWGICGVIPTAGSTQTVNATEPVLGNLSNVDTDGILAVTLQADFYRQSSGIGYILLINNTWNNHNAIGLASGSSTNPGQFQAAGYAGGGAWQNSAFYNWDGRNGKARVAFMYAQGAHRMCVNGYSVDYSGLTYYTGRNAPTTVTNIKLSGLTARLSWKDLAIWNRTTTEHTDITALSIPRCEKFYIYEGDSLTDFSDDQRAVDRKVRELLGNPVDLVISNFARGSSKIQLRGGKGTPMALNPSVRDNTPFVQAAFAASNATDKQLSYQIGINDRISSPIISASEVFNNHVAYINDIKATNPDVKISVETNTAYSTGTTAQDMATLLRAGFGTTLLADHLSDLGADPDFDDATATANTTYYNADRLHYNKDAGNDRQALYKARAHMELAA